MCLCLCDCILVLLAVIFPPLPVWIKRGLCSADSLINILLCCLGYFPGLIHSWYIISKYPEDQYIIIDEEQQLYIPPNPQHTNTIYVTVASPRAQSPIESASNTTTTNAASGDALDLGNYGATNDEPTEAPPAYDHVMNDTMKNVN